MITLKDWNSFSEDTRKNILGLLGKSRKTTLFKPFHHNFDYSSDGKMLKNILKQCVKNKSGKIVVSVEVTPTYPKPEPKKVIEKKVSTSTPTLKRYICYYEERNKNGELVDDFKEWCDAYSESEARREFESRYRHSSSTKISMIVEERR